MYNEHFGLNEQPFGLTPNTQFFLNTRGHNEAFNLLQVALANGEGFIKIVGEVGTGKTMLCRKLLNSLGDDYYTAYVPNPMLEPESLYRAVAQELGLRCKSSDTLNDIQHLLNVRLIEIAEGRARPAQGEVLENYVDQFVNEGELAEQPQKVVLVIDEAQAMSEQTMEALRLISNLETESSKLIQIVLFGQPELDRLLSSDSLRQLRQRITFAYQLPPLDQKATKDYVNHRVMTAGYNGEQLFNDQCLKVLYRITGGVPRLINILCNKALMCAFGKGDRVIANKHIKAAVRDTEGVEWPGLWRYRLWGLSAALVLSVSFVAGYLGGLL
jgi:MSHA biogenesis protein MshM